MAREQEQIVGSMMTAPYQILSPINPIRDKIETMYRFATEKLEHLYGGYGDATEYLTGRVDNLHHAVAEELKQSDGDIFLTKHLFPAIQQARQYDKMKGIGSNSALHTVRLRLPSIFDVWVNIPVWNPIERHGVRQHLLDVVRSYHIPPVWPIDEELEKDIRFILVHGFMKEELEERVKYNRFATNDFDKAIMTRINSALESSS